MQNVTVDDLRSLANESIERDDELDADIHKVCARTYFEGVTNITPDFLRGVVFASYITTKALQFAASRDGVLELNASLAIAAIYKFMEIDHE